MDEECPLLPQFVDFFKHQDVVGGLADFLRLHGYNLEQAVIARKGGYATPVVEGLVMIEDAPREPTPGVVSSASMPTGMIAPVESTTA